MKIFFLRHGVAVEAADWDGAEADRPLTPDGEAAVRREAAAIAAAGFGIAAVVSSPYARAARTAELVAEALGLPVRLDPRLAPGFGAKRLPAVLGDLPEDAPVLLVGHEPDFSAAIGELIGGGNVEMKKGSLACVKLRDPADRRGELAALLPPAFLSR